MKHLSFFILLLSIIFTSCSKNDVSVSEDQQIEDYVKANNITVTEKTTSGLRYIRTLASTGVAVKAGQTILVNYNGKFLSGSSFDSGTFGFKLGAGQVVKGFDEGIAKMKVGEKATLIFPSSIGYGSTGSGSIPGNTPLLFEIQVLNATN